MKYGLDQKILGQIIGQDPTEDKSYTVGFRPLVNFLTSVLVTLSPSIKVPSTSNFETCLPQAFQKLCLTQAFEDRTFGKPSRPVPLASVQKRTLRLRDRL